FPGGSERPTPTLRHVLATARPRPRRPVAQWPDAWGGRCNDVALGYDRLTLLGPVAAVEVSLLREHVEAWALVFRFRQGTSQ
ncbi:MAG: hypothetical protein AAFV53_37865, partial [Myxococcota bacterium]